MFSLNVKKSSEIGFVCWRKEKYKIILVSCDESSKEHFHLSRRSEFSKNFPLISDINYFASSFTFFDLPPEPFRISLIDRHKTWKIAVGNSGKVLNNFLFVFFLFRILHSHNFICIHTLHACEREVHTQHVASTFTSKNTYTHTIIRIIFSTY